MTLSDSVRAQIEGVVSRHAVVLFMKGNRRSPQCGFSAQVVQILDGIADRYETVDVLSDPALRDGIKEFSSWPTIPQLYIRGQFVGGCDIVKEMLATGELGKLLGAEPPRPPKITISGRAAAAIGEAGGDAEGEILRLAVSADFQNELYFDARTADDLAVTSGAITILVDPGTARRADGVSIDYVEGAGGAGFRIDNPNEPPRVRPLTAAELAARLGSGEPVHLFDVRPEVERRRARIEAARALDAAGVEALEALDKDAFLVFQCHHGVRSRAAAEEALRRGFSRVYNLEGGIDAWSRDVDATVPRY